MGYFNQFWEWMAGKLAEIGAIEEAAEVGYDTAMSMCGNSGQVSIIDQTGYGAFEDAAAAAADDTGGTYDILVAACPYPEAVDQILQDSAAAILDYINQATGEFLNDDGGGDDGGGGSDEEEDDGWGWS